MKMSFSASSGISTHAMAQKPTPKPKSMSKPMSKSMPMPKRNTSNTNATTGTNVINSYASQNPSLFGTGIGNTTAVSTPNVMVNNTGRINMGSMLTRLSGLKPGCGSCRAKG